MLASPAQVEAATLPSGITHHWDFKEGSGTTINDIVGSADGTVHGTTTNVWGRQDQAGNSVFKYNGSDNYVDLSDISFPTTAFSIAVVFAVDRNEITDSSGNERRWVHFGDNDGNGLISILVDDDDGSGSHGFKLQIKDGAGGLVQLNITANEYWELPLVVQAGWRSSDDSLYLRVNKKEVTGTGALGTSPTTPVFYLGRSDINATERFAQGWMAEAVWWDGKFLSSSERDDAFNALWARVNGSGPTVTKQDNQISFTAHATPYDGEREAGAGAAYTPLWTTENNIYVGAPITRGATEQTRLARLSKSYVEQEDVQLAARFHGTVGHRHPSVAVDPNGTVVAHAGAHGESAEYQNSTSTEDLSTLTATADPSDGDLRADYRRFFLDTANSKLYGVFRGNGTDDSDVILWDNVNTQWDTVGAAPITGLGGNDANYGGIAIASDGTLYKIIEGRNGGPGYPRQGAGVAKSTDGGTTWTDLEGNAFTLRMEPSEYTYAMPRTVKTGSGVTNRDVAHVQLWLDSNDNPIVVAVWQNSLWGDDRRHIWIAIWNDTGGYFTIHKLVGAETANSIGLISIGQEGDTLFAVYSNEDPRDTATFADAGGPLYLLVSRDNGTSWTRHILDDGTGYGASSAHFAWGASIDPRANAVDGVTRILPHSNDVPTLSEIWEFSLPVAAASSGSGRGTPQISSIQAKEITSTSAMVTWHTSTAAETRLVGEGAPEADPTPKTSHEVSVTDLSPDTLYRYTIHARETGSSAESTATIGLKTFAAPSPSASSKTLKEAQESAATGSENQEITELLERIKELQLLLIQVAEQLVEALQEQIQAARLSKAE